MDAIEPPIRRTSTPLLVALAALLGILLVAVVVLGQMRSLLPTFTNPFAGRTVDRSQPALLLAVRDLSRYEAASGSFQVIVDLEQDATFLPTSVVGQRTLFVASGSVDAFVDFTNLGNGALFVSADQRTVRASLPHAVLDRPNLDPQHSYVFAQETGIVDRVRGFFDQQPNLQSQLFTVAQQKIAAAAKQSGLAARAETNTRLMLEDMLHSLGYSQVTVTFGS
jgi:hypothetical protein